MIPGRREEEAVARFTTESRRRALSARRLRRGGLALALVAPAAVAYADRIDVTFDVTKAPASTVRCTVVALSSGFTEVGVKTVMIGPAAKSSQRYTASLSTQELAVTGEVSTCELVGSGG